MMQRDRVRREQQRGRTNLRGELLSNSSAYLFDLSDLAGMPTTPNDGSEGAKWLRRTWRDAVEAVEDGSVPAEEFADDAVPIYTHELWQIWIDCDGYHASSDTMDYFLSSGEAGSDLNKVAQGACYDWALRLFENARLVE
jgi:hypothetical protein